MKKIPTEQAVGAVLFHDITGMSEGFKGAIFKRGHVIEESDIGLLLDNGKTHIYICETESNEVHEDDAAIELAEALLGPNIVYTAPSEGKCMLTAKINGLFKVSSSALRIINGVEDVVISSLPNNFTVSQGGRLAGARIIPLTTKRETLNMALEEAKRSAPVFEVKPYRPLKCAMVITGSEMYYGRKKDRFEPVLRAKLEGFGGEITGVQGCPDDLDDIKKAIVHFAAIGAELITVTGGMSVDPDDLTPTAIRQSGAEIITYGSPVQPGNMLMLGYIGQTAVIGVPGAALHFKTTVVDILLPRIFAGERVTKEEIAAWGEGGFCLGCEVCRYPMCYFGRS